MPTSDRTGVTYHFTNISLAGCVEYNSCYRRANLTPTLPDLDSDGRGRGQALQVIGHGSGSNVDASCRSHGRGLQTDQQVPEEMHG